jgi:drug/metabolite transporter (DMT)-like permease
MRNVLLIVGGVLCIASGLVFLPLPTPIGLPLLVTGAALLVAGSAMARRMLKRFRTSNERAHSWLAMGERYLPAFLRLPLSLTHPDSTDV